MAGVGCVALQLGGIEGCVVLGVGDVLLELGERGELAAPALAGRVGDALVDVVREELKRRRLPVFLVPVAQLVARRRGSRAC